MPRDVTAALVKAVGDIQIMQVKHGQLLDNVAQNVQQMNSVLQQELGYRRVLEQEVTRHDVKISEVIIKSNTLGEYLKEHVNNHWKMATLIIAGAAIAVPLTITIIEKIHTF